MRSRLNAVARRWWLVLLSVVVGAGIASVAVTAMDPTYRASSDILVQQVDAETASPGARAVESYAAVIESRGLTAPTAEELGLDLDQNVTASPRGDSDVIRLEVEQNNAGKAVEAAGNLGDRFVSWLAQNQPDEGPRVEAQIIGQAFSTGDPVGPDATPWVLGGILVGLLAGVALALLSSAGPRVVDGAGIAKQITKAPLLASIGHDPDARTAPLVSQIDGAHPRHEAMRILRTNLAFLDVDRPHQVLTVTSSLPSEGKSTTVANLGITIAETGRSVVIVEGDLRQPRLGELFGLERTVGVTTALVGRVSVDEAIQSTRQPGLDVLTSGTLPPNPTEILGTDAMLGLISELRRRYDVVLIDAPPVLPVADATILASISDGTIVLTRHGRTRVAELTDTTTRLADVGADLIGVVLTMSPRSEVSRYGYGSGYGPAHHQQQSRRQPSAKRRART